MSLPPRLRDKTLLTWLQPLNQYLDFGVHHSPVVFFVFPKIFYFVYFWLCWVFIAVWAFL